MNKIVLMSDEAAGNGSSEPETKPAPAIEPKAEPPVTAKIIANGKTERELLLERQNARLLKTARKISDEKIEVEKQVAVTTRENEKLREQVTATKQKMSWMGFTG
jgi:hypothetical protein